VTHLTSWLIDEISVVNQLNDTPIDLQRRRGLAGARLTFSFGVRCTNLLRTAGWAFLRPELATSTTAVQGFSRPPFEIAQARVAAFVRMAPCVRFGQRARALLRSISSLLRVLGEGAVAGVVPELWC
jgi:hypothetical protein